MRQVEIIEVAPRDGFQAVKPFIARVTAPLHHRVAARIT